MSKTITPSVGRKVWYWPSLYDLASPHASADNPMPGRGMRQVTGEAFDATVLCVHGDRCVNLLVVDHCGVTHYVPSASLMQPGDDKPAHGYAEWMPYQVGQAKKDEAVALTAEKAWGTMQRVHKILTDDPIEAEILAKCLTAPRVTPEDLEAEVVSEHYFTARQGVDGADIEQLRASEPTAPLTLAAFADDPDLSKTRLAPLNLLTFCVLTLKNGFTLVGKSAVASPENFNAELGRKIARKDAIEQLWPLLGFRLRDKLSPVPTIPIKQVEVTHSYSAIDVARISLHDNVLNGGKDVYATMKDGRAFITNVATLDFEPEARLQERACAAILKVANDWLTKQG